MWTKIPLTIILIAAVIILQTALKSSGLWLLGDINLILILSVILINLTEFDNVLIFIFFSGWLADLYSSLPFGLITLSLILTAVVSEILFYNFFTNRSFYSLLILGLIATVIYNLFFLGLTGMVYLIGWSDFYPRLDYFWHFLAQLAGTIIILIISFSFINYLSKRFKPIFLNS